jgi:hypothetical protein
MALGACPTRSLLLPRPPCPAHPPCLLSMLREKHPEKRPLHEKQKGSETAAKKGGRGGFGHKVENV